MLDDKFLFTEENVRQILTKKGLLHRRVDDKIYIDQSSNPIIEGRKTFLKIDTLVFGVICVSSLSVSLDSIPRTAWACGELNASERFGKVYLCDSNTHSGENDIVFDLYIHLEDYSISENYLFRLIDLAEGHAASAFRNIQKECYLSAR